MRPDPVALDDLLASLADGTAIDWTALEAEARDEPTRRRFRNLRLVARVAELHRSQPLEDVPGDMPAPSSDGAEPPVTWGRLRVGTRLASGAYGDVYRARDAQLDRDVALKLLRTRADGADTIRLLAEAQALAKVSHPNVVIVHGADVHDDRPGLWMELIDGQTLAALADRGLLGAAETIAIGRDVCRALSAIHAAGLVHGDVKTQNVMRESGGRIVLMDFGAGRRRGAALAAAGTPLYLAPEVLAGGPPTPQGDLYSLGVLMFTLLSGRYPYEADDLEALRRAHADRARLFLRDLRPDLPDRLVDAVERVLDPDPARRFATSGAMERALEAAQSSPRPSWKLATIAALLTAAVVSGVALLWPRPTLPSIAVLTFASSDPESQHLINGLNEDVVRELQRFEVFVKTTAGAGVLAGLPDFDRRLGADAIVSGNARREPGGTGITVAIRRAATTPFWTQDYSVGDAVPALAATIARDIAAVLGAPLRSNAAPLYQPDQRAYDAYRRGRLAFELRTQADLARSRTYFTQAAELDPRFALPWVGMADVYLALGVPPFGDLRPREARVKAREATERALQIDPDLVEAQTSLAWSAALYDWNWPDADARFKRAISLNPQYAQAHHWYANFLTDMGRFKQAEEELERAQALEPASIIIKRDFGWIAFMDRRYDDAIRHLRDALALDPTFVPAITLMARALAAQGDFAGALAEVERYRVVDPGAHAPYLSLRGYVEARAGNPRASGTLTELRAVAQQQYVTPYYFALIHTALGQHAPAVAELQRAYDEQDSTLGSVNVDPRFDALRADPRFQAIISAMRFPAIRR